MAALLLAPVVVYLSAYVLLACRYAWVYLKQHRVSE